MFTRGLKIKTNISILLSAIIGFIVIFISGYQFLRTKEQAIYYQSKAASDSVVINKVLENHKESFLKPTKDNAAWDDMVNLTKTHDTIWARENLLALISNFGMSCMGVFSNNGKLIYSLADQGKVQLNYSPETILKLFEKKRVIHTFTIKNNRLYELFGATIVPTADVNRETPASGFLISTKYWDEPFVNDLASSSGFKAKLYFGSDRSFLSNSIKIEEIVYPFYDAQNKIIAQLYLYRTNALKNELKTLSYFAVLGVLALILGFTLVLYFTNRWILRPLKDLTQSLGGEDVGTLSRYASKANEFGTLALMIQRYNMQKAELIKEIEERTIVEENLKSTMVELEKALKAKSEFMAIMSHEIRTPMNGIIGMTELALTTKLSATQRDYLESVQTSAYLLLEIINNILDFSKIDAGMLEIENIDFNLREVVERSLDILTVKAFEKKLELLCEIDPELPEMLVGDALRIRQILVNFISNAIKFTDEGEICVTVKKLYGSNEPNADIRLLFSVKDTGIGIPENKIDAIFDQFTQADTSTTRKYGGTGLGLSISKKLTEMMGGDISVISELGVGSTFSFELPVRVSSTNRTLHQNGELEIKTVLVVDDNATNLKILHDMLAHWGIEAVLANNGHQAIQLLKEANEKNKLFDLVILDMHMPHLDGLTVAEMIRNDLGLTWEPVIFMYSSIERDHIKDSGEKVSVDLFLTKPVKMKDLYHILVKEKYKSKTIEEEPTMTVEENVTIAQGKTILIAEDNLINQKLLLVMLSKTGANVITALNGAQAIEQLHQNHVDLIFMDIHMPVLDGFQATQQIRAEEEPGKHLPIVALTAITMEGDREKCLNAGMDDYLSKPFKKEELFTLVEKYLA